MWAPNSTIDPKYRQRTAGDCWDRVIVGVRPSLLTLLLCMLVMQSEFCRLRVCSGIQSCCSSYQRLVLSLQSDTASQPACGLGLFRPNYCVGLVSCRPLPAPALQPLLATLRASAAYLQALSTPAHGHSPSWAPENVQSWTDIFSTITQVQRASGSPFCCKQCVFTGLTSL